MKQRLSAIFLLLLLQLAVQAQQILFQDKQELHFLIRASDAGGEAQFIFQKLAEGQNRPTSSVEFTVTYEQSIRVLRTSHAHVKTSFEGKSFRIGGDVFYRGFDMSKSLVPDEMSFVAALKVTGSNQAPIVANSRAEISSGTTERIENSYTDSVHNNLRLEISQQKFFYRNTALNSFRQRINLVGDYYVASSQIEPLHQRLRSVNPSDIDRIDFQNENLQNIENTIAQMESQDFEGNLNLRSFDPLRFLVRFHELKQEAFRLRSALNEVKSTLYLHFYNAGLDFLVRGKKQMAKNYFIRSIRENPMFAPAAYQVAFMDYNEGCVDDAAENGRDIMNRMNPDPDIRRLTIRLLNDIYREYLRQAEQFNNQENYSRTIAVIDRAERLCQSVSSVHCSEAMNVQYRKARNGQYQDKLDEARREYQQNNLARAESILHDALRFQSTYSREITSADDANSMLKGIRQKKYELTVETGRMHLRQQFFDKALQSFTDADAMQQKYSLAQNPDLDALKKQSARQLIYSKIILGNDLVKANSLGEARRLAKEIVSMQSTYGLTADQEINTRYSSLKQGIFSQACVNAQNELDAKYRKMHEAIGRKDFLEANAIYLQADKFLQDNSECGLNSGNLRAEHDSIVPGYVYQSLMKEVLFMQSNTRFTESLSKFIEAENYFHRYEVSRFGITHKPLPEFAGSNFNNVFLMFLGNNFRSKKEYDHALAMYKVLLLRKVAPKYFKDGLYQLGVELALRDRQTMAAADPKQKVLEYTSGDKNMKNLSKGYLKGWKMKGK